MSRPGSIPPNLESEVLARAGEGYSSRKIADWLKTAHGVETSHTAVNRFLKEHRQERSEATKRAAREKLGETVPKDIDELASIRQRLRKYEDDAVAADDMPTALKAVDLQIKTIDRALHFAGADEKDEAEDLASALESVLDD